MAELVEFELKDGGFVLAEVEEVAPRGERPIGRSGLAEKAALGFEEALGSLKPIVQTVFGKLREQVEAVDEIKVEFGFKLSGATGVVIAKTETEGNFKLSLTWKAKV